MQMIMQGALKGASLLLLLCTGIVSQRDPVTANTQKYGGHDVFNLRLNWPLGKDVSLSGSVNNLANRRYADSAQLSGVLPVLSPGLPRTWYAGLEAKW